MSRLIVITGGSKGLGAAMAAQAVEAGSTVVSMARSASPAGDHVSVDFSDPTQVYDVMAATVGKYVDGQDYDGYVLINNAGTLDPIGSDQTSAEILQNLNVNFVSQIMASRAFLRAIDGKSGRHQIVNISSGAANTAYEGWSLYCSSKAGLEQFARVVAVEQTHVSNPAEVVNISPGVMDTNMQTTIRASAQSDFPNRERFVGLYEDGHLSDPADVASCILAGIDSATRYAGQTVDFRQHSRGEAGE